jgi:hypothetical protein
MNPREISATGSRIAYKNRWMQIREDSIVRADGTIEQYDISGWFQTAHTITSMDHKLLLH